MRLCKNRDRHHLLPCMGQTPIYQQCMGQTPFIYSLVIAINGVCPHSVNRYLSLNRCLSLFLHMVELIASGAKQSVEVAVKEGKYIYCIIETEEPKSFGPLGIGERGDELRTICFNDIAAVVSNSLIKEYPVSRENLVPHERAIEEVMKSHTVLPVRFCTIAEDEGKVKKILESEYDRFKDLLGGIRGKKELGLKAIFKEEIIYKDIAENYDEIKRLKEIIASRPSEQAYYERVEIGKMVEIALENERERYKKEILESLLPLAEDVKINDTYGERMLLNAAFLVNKDKEQEFDQKVNELAERYSEKIKFKYVGTLPPFNFVNLLIITEEY